MYILLYPQVCYSELSTLYRVPGALFYCIYSYCYWRKGSLSPFYGLVGSGTLVGAGTLIGGCLQSGQSGIPRTERPGMGACGRPRWRSHSSMQILWNLCTFTGDNLQLTLMWSRALWDIPNLVSDAIRDRANAGSAKSQK